MSSKRKLSIGSTVCPAFLLTLLICSGFAHAALVTGRLTVGGYAASETFQDADGGSVRNDFLTASSRLYLQASQMGQRKNWQLTTDVRDKHDFFDKLDRERLQLNERNTVQVRQLNARYDSSGRRTFTTVGRFPVLEAGNVHSDGVMAGLSPSATWTLAAFGGLNAKRNDQQYVTYNPESIGYGAYARYQSDRRNWNKNLYGSLAFVEQQYEGQVDRRYLYTTSLQQWSGRARLIHFLYLDFVPRTYVQTAYLDWAFGLSNSWTAGLRGLAVDVIEYSRRQGVRESLEPSPYKEGTFSLIKNFHAKLRTIVDVTYGKRSSDNLDKKEYKLKFQMPQLISNRWDSSLTAIVRDNFVSQDTLGRASLGYFSRRWEMSLDFETGVEKYDSGEILHPLVAEISYGRYFSRRAFLALSIERAQDEEVAINSAFFKFTYRFGNEDVAPIRDGASPRGRL